MVKSVSLAKISRPRIFDVVHRERIYRQLDDLCDRPLAWISGPPGAGKTTLLASYLDVRARPFIWYQVDAGDADPATFFQYLHRAATTLHAVAAAALPRWVPDHVHDLPGFSRLYFRALFESLPADLALVLDNYQELPEDAPLQDVIRQCITEVPAGRVVFAVSRVDPPRAFVTLRATSRLARVEWDTLRFSLDEVRSLCRERRITDEWLLQALHLQSGGWAAGITLMLERLGHFDGQARDLPTESREAVFDYFASLIFDQSSQTDRDILLSLAHLPSMTPTLASTVSGSDDAAALLDHFYQRRLFIDRRPGVEPIYQFHALFQEFLKARTRLALTPSALEARLRRSARALEDAGEKEAAVPLYLDAQDWREASRMVREQAAWLLDCGRGGTLLHWIESLPASVRELDPWLLYWQGCAQSHRDTQSGLRTLVRALALFEQNALLEGSVTCLTALLQVAFIGFGAMDAMDEWLDALMAKLESGPPFSDPTLELRARAVLSTALFHVRPWHPLTLPTHAQVTRLLLTCETPSVAISAAMGAVHVGTFCRDFDGMDEVVQATEPFARHVSANPSDAAWWFGQVAYLRFMQTRDTEALACLEEGCRLARANGLAEVLGVLTGWRFSFEMRCAGWPTALRSLSEFEKLPLSRLPFSSAIRCLFQSRRAAYLGQDSAAAQLARESIRAVNGMGSRYEELALWQCNAEILLQYGQVEEARTLIDACQSVVARTPAFDSFAAVMVYLEAWFIHQTQGPAQCLTTLRQALVLARSGTRRYYFRLLWCSMPQMFSLALEHDIETDLVCEIIRAYALPPPAHAPDSWPWRVSVRALGQFEVCVDGEPVQFSRKLPRKVLLLLKAIVSCGGRDVPEQFLCDALWPDEEGDAARSALAITLVRLRKLLRHGEAVQQLGGRISLGADACWVDAWAFESHADQGRAGPAVALYTGAFLPDDEELTWSVAVRERLRGKFIRAVVTHGLALETGAHYEAALDAYQRGIDADPVVESFHQGLMRCYALLGRQTEAISAFRRLRQTLSVLLGVPPSDTTRALYEEILAGQRNLLGDDTDTTIVTLPAGSQRRGR